MSHLVYERLKVKNSDIYGEADLDLAYQGITVIYGLNKDANHGSTNAAGKSRLFSYIPELLFNSSPLVSKRDKRTSGVEKLALRRGDDHLVVTRTGRKGGESLSLNLNGKELGTRTKSYAQQRLAKFLDRTEEEFYTLDYVDSARPNLFQRGTTAQRRTFLIDLFRLEEIDLVRKLFAQELRKLVTDKAVFKELVQQYKKLKADLGEVDVSALTAQVSRGQEVLADLTAKVEELRSIQTLIDLEKANRKQVALLLESGISLAEDWSEYTDRLQSKQARLELLEDEARRYAAYRQQRLEWEESNTQVLRKLAKLKIDKDLTKAKIQAFASKYKQASDRLADLLEEREELTSSMPAKVDFDRDDLLVNRKNLEAQIHNFQSLIDLKDQLTKGNCPTCKQSVPSGLFVGLSAKVAKLQSRLDKAEEAHKAKEILDKRKQIRNSLDEVQARISVCEAAVRRYKPYVAAADLQEELSLPPAKQPKPKRDLASVKASLRQVTAALVLVDTLRPIQDQLRKAQKLTRAQRYSCSHLDELKDELTRHIEKLPHRQSRLDQALQAQAQIKEVKAKLAPLRASINDEEALKLLVEAYGNEGIKKLMVQRVAKHLEDCLNKYARFVYSESYKFEIRLGTQFEILVHKRYLGKVKTVEVRRLSGAESRMFSLLLIMSFVSLMPESRRSNLLILDEPSANMGEEMRNSFWSFLPVLNKVIPHIVVITPNSSEGLESARCFTAVKKNGVSRLVEGRPR